MGVSYLRSVVQTKARSPGTCIGSWVIDSIGLYRDSRTGTQYVGNWASRVIASFYNLALACSDVGWRLCGFSGAWLGS